MNKGFGAAVLRCFAFLIALMLIIPSATLCAIAECEHRGMLDEVITITRYDSSGDSGHYTIFDRNYVCADCGKTVNVFWDYSFDAHSFNSNGRCVCGYTMQTDEAGSPTHSPEATLPPQGDSEVNPNTCKHTYTKTVTEAQSISPQSDGVNHKITVVNKTVCSACSAVLKVNGKEYQILPHDFDSTGKCRCGYSSRNNVCDHKPNKTLIGVPEYSVYDNEYHRVTENYHFECECQQINYNKANTYIAPHEFTRGICEICGYNVKYGRQTGLPIVIAYWEGSNANLDIPSYSFMDRSLTFSHPKHPDYMPTYCSVYSAFDELWRYYDLNVSNGITTFTFSNELPAGSYAVYFSDDKGNSSRFMVTLGVENEIYLVVDSQPLFENNKFDSGIKSYKSGRYLAAENNFIYTCRSYPERAVFNSFSEFISLLTLKFSEVEDIEILDPREFHFLTFDRADPSGDYNPLTCFNHYYYVFGCEGWYLASNETGEVYVTDSITDDCYWILCD